MTNRLRAWARAWLIALDQLAYVWIAGWLYVWLGHGACPNPDETISSCVGRNAEKGRAWALVAEKAIDALFGAGHCRRAIGR